MADGDAFDQATERARQRRVQGPYAVSAHYDRRVGRIVVVMSSGIELAFPPRCAQGLENAKPADLAEIEITPSGLGLHFPRLGADLYVPGLIDGVFGTKAWMAARLGASGGKSKSAAKAAASRANGKLGGRPRRRSASG